MWELDYKESWAPKHWCFWTVVLAKTLENPLDCKEIQPVHPEGNQSWIFIGRTDAEAETPILWPPDAKNWLIGKDRDAGKDWRQEKGTTEGEMVGWHHWLNGHEFEQAPGVVMDRGPGVLQSMGSQRVGHDWATELNSSLNSLVLILFSKIAAGGDCSHEIKRHLLLGRKVMANLDSMLKSRDITLLTKVNLVKAMVFPVVMYGCESWSIKKAEHQIIDAVALRCWRRLLRVP